MTNMPNQSKMLLTLEAFASRIMGVTEKIPTESFTKIIDGILIQNFNALANFNCSYDSIAVWEDFETFSIESDGDGYFVDLELKVNYEVLRGEVVNDVTFSIDEMTVYDNGGDEMVIDHMQAEQIKQAVDSKNFKA